MSRAAGILITAWAGSLWTICVLVAPLLFATLEDRRAAGRMAARLFQVEAWLGLMLGLALAGLVAARQSLRVQVGPLWCVALTAAAPLVSELALTPLMEAARLAGEMGRFGLLHGVSAALFFTACLGALGLVWRFSRPAG